MNIDSGEGCSNLKRRKRRIGKGEDEYDILKEFSYEDYVVESSMDNSHFPILCSPSKSNDTCRYEALGDVYNTRRTILEATLPWNETKYFNNCFGDKMSVSHLIESNPGKTSDLLEQMEVYGVTSEMHYDKVEEEDEEQDEEARKFSRFKGCPKFKIDGWFRFSGKKINVTEADIEKEFLPVMEKIPPVFRRSATTEIKHFGPIIGEYDCTLDNNKLCTQSIYNQTDKRERFDTDGTRLGHAVMIIGFGIARKVSTGDIVTYYVIQNNWGPENSIGRILTSIMKYGFAPTFNNQCDIVEFMEEGGIDNVHLVDLKV